MAKRKKRKATKKKSKNNIANLMKPAKSNEAVMHVMIPAPVTLRKQILTIAIESTQLLKQYEEYAELKEKKVRTVNFLQRSLMSIRNLSKQLDKSLPKLPEQEMREMMKEKTSIEAEPLSVPEQLPKQEQVAKPAPAEKPEPKPEPPKEMSEIDRLKAELAEVEGKLGKV